MQKGVPKIMTDAARKARSDTGKINIRKTRAPEAIAKMAASKRGSKASEETKAKKSLALKGRPWSEARRAAQNSDACTCGVDPHRYTCVVYRRLKQAESRARRQQ